jgi:hypothetical protein
MSGRLPGKPAYLWLWYADGGPLPEISPYCDKVPAFKCSYGPTIEDCQRQVEAHLDGWYANFNLLFTLTRPTSGDYYTLVITSDGSQCQLDPNEEAAGIAPNNCNDNPGQTAFAYTCGYSAHACATIIAHEHGHMVGLEHTTVSTTDIMNRAILGTAEGFDDQTLKTLEGGTCYATQNSYQQMLAALGAWPGGSKPSPFSALSDAGAPDLPAPDNVDASTSGSVGPTPTGGDGGIAVVPGYDAPGIVRPTLPTADAATPTSEKGGGCNLAGTATSASASVMILLLLVLLLARQTGLNWRLRGFVARARGTATRRP